MRHPVRFLAAILICLIACFSPARALIMVGGTNPVSDQNWPLGTVDLANLPSRVGYWEGPPFGGGQYQFLYRGDAPALQTALDAFAKIRAPALRVVLHEGPQENQFLKADPARQAADQHVDWTFTVWDPRNWNSLYNNPASVFSSSDPSRAFRNPVDPPILDIYLAGPDGKGLDWANIKLPPGLTLVDERATAAGYPRADGCILRGDIYDIVTSKPIPNASILLATAPATKPTALTDSLGHFEIKHLSPGFFPLILSAPGYVDRSLGSITFTPNSLKQLTLQLAPPATLKGTVHDTAGKPLPGVIVRPDATLAADGRGYLLANPIQTTSDAQGAFELAGIPQGFLQLRASKDPYYPLDSLHLFSTPTNSPIPAPNIDLIMTATGTIKGRLLNPDGTPASSGNVSARRIGEQIGHWGGSAAIHADGTFEFTQVPPDTYILSSDLRASLTGEDPNGKKVDLKAGQTLTLELTQPTPAPRRSAPAAGLP